MIVGVFDQQCADGVPLTTEVWTKVYGLPTIFILKLSAMGDLQMIFATTVTIKGNASIPLSLLA
jgi:hypothetical protein